MRSRRVGFVVTLQFGLSGAFVGVSVAASVAASVNGCVDGRAVVVDLTSSSLGGGGGAAGAGGSGGCADGQKRPCYSGPATTRGVGLCADGSQTCSQSLWGVCQADTLPVAETCDGTDDDCDGVTDDGCACSDGETWPCYSGPKETENVGICSSGTLSCQAGQWPGPEACSGDQPPQVEDCDIGSGADEDCDGDLDCADSDCEASSCSDEGQLCRSQRCVWEGVNCAPCPWGYEAKPECNGKFSCNVPAGRSARYFDQGQWHDGCAICNMGGGIAWEIW